MRLAQPQREQRQRRAQRTQRHDDRHRQQRQPGGVEQFACQDRRTGRADAPAPMAKPVPVARTLAGKPWAKAE
jgi:hypothetical protein